MWNLRLERMVAEQTFDMEIREQVVLRGVDADKHSLHVIQGTVATLNVWFVC